MIATDRQILECPHCGEPTQANRLADGSLICSCPAARILPALAPVAMPPRSVRQ
jgi:ribosomal protein L37AE/L43A